MKKPVTFKTPTSALVRRVLTDNRTVGRQIKDRDIQAAVVQAQRPRPSRRTVTVTT